MKTKRNNRGNKNRKTMKVGGGNMFRKKIASDYAGTTPIVSGTFWKKGHGGIVGSYDWKKRKYELYESNNLDEPYFVLIYFLLDEKTEKGHIKFNEVDVFNEDDVVNPLTESDLIQIKKKYKDELMDNMIELKKYKTKLESEPGDTAERLSSQGKGLIIKDINDTEYPIFFENESDCNNFRVAVQTTIALRAPNGGRARPGRKTRKHKRKTRRRKNKKRKSRTRSIRRQ